jgi:hypothetical protein
MCYIPDNWGRTTVILYGFNFRIFVAVHADTVHADILVTESLVKDVRDFQEEYLSLPLIYHVSLQ